jgi:hypothetical protein
MLARGARGHGSRSGIVYHSRSKRHQGTGPGFHWHSRAPGRLGAPGPGPPAAGRGRPHGRRSERLEPARMGVDRSGSSPPARRPHARVRPTGGAREGDRLACRRGRHRGLGGSGCMPAKVGSPDRLRQGAHARLGERTGRRDRESGRAPNGPVAPAGPIPGRTGRAPAAPQSAWRARIAPSLPCRTPPDSRGAAAGANPSSDTERATASPRSAEVGRAGAFDDDVLPPGGAASVRRWADAVEQRLDFFVFPFFQGALKKERCIACAPRALRRFRHVRGLGDSRPEDPLLHQGDIFPGGDRGPSRRNRRSEVGRPSIVGP